MRTKENIINTYFEFPIDIRWEFISFIDSQINAEFMVDTATQFVLLDMNVETVGYVSAFAISSNQFVVPGRYIVLQRPIRKNVSDKKFIYFTTYYCFIVYYKKHGK